jgi:hypothetical protein
MLSRTRGSEYISGVVSMVRTDIRPLRIGYLGAVPDSIHGPLKTLLPSQTKLRLNHGTTLAASRLVCDYRGRHCKGAPHRRDSHVARLRSSSGPKRFAGSQDRPSSEARPPRGRDLGIHLLHEYGTRNLEIQTGLELQTPGALLKAQ